MEGDLLLVMKISVASMLHNARNRTRKPPGIGGSQPRATLRRLLVFIWGNDPAHPYALQSEGPVGDTHRPLHASVIGLEGSSSSPISRRTRPAPQSRNAGELFVVPSARRPSAQLAAADLR
jgi:hypothetical protein